MRAWAVCYSNICDYKSTSSLRTCVASSRVTPGLPTVTLAILFLLRISSSLFKAGCNISLKMPHPYPHPGTSLLDFLLGSCHLLLGTPVCTCPLTSLSSSRMELSLWLLSGRVPSAAQEPVVILPVSVAPPMSLHTTVCSGLSFRSISAFLTPRPLPMPWFL